MNDAELKSTANYEVKGEDKFCKKPVTEPRKAGEIWVDGEGIQPFSSSACTLGAYAEIKAKGKKINIAYVYDTARGIKLSVAHLPAGITASFSRPMVNAGGVSTLRLTASSVLSRSSGWSIASKRP